MFLRSVLTAVTAALLTFGSVSAASPASAAPSGVPASSVPGVPGFDISGAQADVDWNKVVADGAKFVFITATEGSGYQYPNFARLAAGARGVDLVLGAAHFAVPSASSGAVQADYFAGHGGAWSADGRTLPGTLDLEINPFGAACYGLSQSGMVSWISAFVNEYHAKTSRWPIIYTTTDWWTTCTGNSGAFAANDPLFIARPFVSPSPGPLPGGWGFYTFWQWADSGTFPGGQDVFNGTVDQLIRLALNG
jgi:GH25 family lysozyme M1 (1,4-beta-N-acetylmuramidase)